MIYAHKKRKKYFSQFIISGFVLQGSIYGLAAMDFLEEGKYSELVEYAEKTSPLAHRAINEERAFRQETIRQIEALRLTIQNSQESDKVEDAEVWKDKILNKLEIDRNFSKQLSKELEAFKAGIDVPYSVKTHKTELILQGTESLIKDHFYDLLDGKPIAGGYSYHQNTITVLGEDNVSTIWGNSKGTYLKTALMYMVAQAYREQSKTFGCFGMNWFDQSAIAHIAPLPSLQVDYSDFSFVSTYKVNDVLSQGLIIPHSGYAFGGMRDEPRYPTGKLHGPQDCSSWIAKVTKSPAAYSTADQLCAYRQLLAQPSFIPEGWDQNLDAQHLLKSYNPVIVQDLQTDIRPGQVFCLRRFNQTDPSMSETLGVGGHTAMVLGIQNNNIVTLGYNRDMPKMEGFGIQEFSCSDEPYKMKMLFNIKSD